MNRFKNHFENIVCYDLIHKYNYTNYYQIPHIKKISISLSSTSLALEQKKIIFFLSALELISNQTASITFSKKNKIHLKIKKGTITGCKLILNKKNSYLFLENLILFILPNIKEFDGFSINNKIPNVLTFSINNLLDFLELQNEFLIYSKIPSILINIHLKSNNIQESKFLLNSLNFPIKN